MIRILKIVMVLIRWSCNKRLRYFGNVQRMLTKHPNITKYTTIWMDSIRDGKSELVNTNKLVRNYEGCTGLKTGSTSLALYNLSARQLVTI